MLLTNEDLRTALTNLNRPDRLDTPAIRRLLAAHNAMPADMAPLSIGKAIAELLHQKIEAIRSTGSTRADSLPYRVLDTCFVDGKKASQAARELGLSERQLSRERTRAITILRHTLTSMPTWLRMMPQGVPPAGDLLPRPELERQVAQVLGAHRRVSVEGGPGAGKTTLVAAVARESGFDWVFWHTFRPGVSVTLGALLFELANQLAWEQNPTLSHYLEETLPAPEMGIATRLALQILDDERRRLIVLDDYHHAERVREIVSFADEITKRVHEVCLVTIARTDADAPAVHVPRLVIPASGD